MQAAQQTPFAPGPDPVINGQVTTQAGRQKAILDQVKDGRGFLPGQFSIDDGKHLKIFGTDPTNLREFSTKLADEFKAVGRGIIASNPVLMKSWNDMIAAQAASTGTTAEKLAIHVHRTKVSTELHKATAKLGLEAIPEADRAARRAAFQEKVVAMTTKGKKRGGGSQLFTVARSPNLTVKAKKELREWAGESFDAWGPVAEAALDRNLRIRRMSRATRVHNADTLGYFSYRDRETWHHEFGHSIENHVVRPKVAGGRTIAGKPPESFWNERIESRDQAPARWLGDLTGNRSYSRRETAKEDKWADPYMGKAYRDGSGEIVSMLSEPYGGHFGLWRRQMDKDPTAIEEFLGYMVSVARGETTRLNRMSQ